MPLVPDSAAMQFLSLRSYSAAPVGIILFPDYSFSKPCQPQHPQGHASGLTHLWSFSLPSFLAMRHVFLLTLYLHLGSSLKVFVIQRTLGVRHGALVASTLARLSLVAIGFFGVRFFGILFPVPASRGVRFGCI